MFCGIKKYQTIENREAIQSLTSNSVDFKTICSYAEIDASQATRKFTEAMKLDLYAMRNDQEKVLSKPRKKYKHKGKFRLTFND